MQATEWIWRRADVPARFFFFVGTRPPRIEKHIQQCRAGLRSYACLTSLVLMARERASRDTPTRPSTEPTLQSMSISCSKPSERFRVQTSIRNLLPWNKETVTLFCAGEQGEKQ